MLVDVTPVFENTTMQASYNNDNTLIGYHITPCEGYVLHSSGYDEPVFNDEMEETGEVILGYTRVAITVNRRYNFETNPLNIYAVLESEVPADRIFGGGNDHEVM